MRAAAATTKAAARTTRDKERGRKRNKDERKGLDKEASRVEAGRNKAHSPCQRLCSGA